MNSTITNTQLDISNVKPAQKERQSNKSLFMIITTTFAIAVITVPNSQNLVTQDLNYDIKKGTYNIELKESSRTEDLGSSIYIKNGDFSKELSNKEVNIMDIKKNKDVKKINISKVATRTGYSGMALSLTALFIPNIGFQSFLLLAVMFATLPIWSKYRDHYRDKWGL